MGVSWEMLAPFIALAITVAAMLFAVVVTGAIRRHDYRRFEDKSAPSLAEKFPLPTDDPSAAEARRKALSPRRGSRSRRSSSKPIPETAMRQYQYLYVVFPSAISPAPADALETQFALEADLVAARVQKGEITKIITRIKEFWSHRMASIASRTLTEADLTADALLVYLQRRARRQLGWFTDSQARLEHIAERRNIVLLRLYCVTALLAVVKHVLYLYGEHFHAYLLPVLLLATGMSAAMTAFYINQNSRSLIHRYNTQQRFITGWLVAFNERWNFASLPSLTIDAAAKNEMRAQILRFEDLMIEELIDWTHITSHDAIELAP